MMSSTTLFMMNAVNKAQAMATGSEHGIKFGSSDSLSKQSSVSSSHHRNNNHHQRGRNESFHGTSSGHKDGRSSRPELRDQSRPRKHHRDASRSRPRERSKSRSRRDRSKSKPHRDHSPSGTRIRNDRRKGDNKSNPSSSKRRTSFASFEPENDVQALPKLSPTRSDTIPQNFGAGKRGGLVRSSSARFTTKNSKEDMSQPLSHSNSMHVSAHNRMLNGSYHGSKMSRNGNNNGLNGMSSHGRIQNRNLMNGLKRDLFDDAPVINRNEHNKPSSFRSNDKSRRKNDNNLSRSRHRNENGMKSDPNYDLRGNSSHHNKRIPRNDSNGSSMSQSSHRSAGSRMTHNARNIKQFLQNESDQHIEDFIKEDNNNKNRPRSRRRGSLNNTSNNNESLKEYLNENNKKKKDDLSGFVIKVESDGSASTKETAPTGSTYSELSGSSTTGRSRRQPEVTSTTRGQNGGKINKPVSSSSGTTAATTPPTSTRSSSKPSSFRSSSDKKKGTKTAPKRNNSKSDTSTASTKVTSPKRTNKNTPTKPKEDGNHENNNNQNNSTKIQQPLTPPKQEKEKIEIPDDTKYSAEHNQLLFRASELVQQGNDLTNDERYDEAIEHYIKSLLLRDQVLGKYHIDTASLYWSIGNCYYSKGDFDNALRAHHRWLRIRRYLNKDVCKPDIMWIIGPLQKKRLSEEQTQRYDDKLKLSLTREFQGDELRKKRDLKAAIAKYKEAIAIEQECFEAALPCNCACHKARPKLVS